MPKRCQTVLRSADLEAVIRSGTHELGALPYRAHIDLEVDFDLSPIRPHVQGRLCTRSPHSDVESEDRGVAIWLRDLSDAEKGRLAPGFEFKVISAKLKDAIGAPLTIGMGVVENVLWPALPLHGGCRSRGRTPERRKERSLASYLRFLIPTPRKDVERPPKPEQERSSTGDALRPRCISLPAQCRAVEVVWHGGGGPAVPRARYVQDSLGRGRSRPRLSHAVVGLE
jgi:hypothetical protein